MVTTKVRLNAPNFICPHCKVNSRQVWIERYLVPIGTYNNSHYELKDNSYISTNTAYDEYGESHCLVDIINLFSIAVCDNCKKATIWIDYKRVYPETLVVSEPIEDMPENVKNLYLEAARIVEDSPKGAGAILRLALQTLIKDLGYEGNINNCIGQMVSDGLDSKIQKAMDSIRVIGNNAVHPGEINLDEAKDDVLCLFKLLNYIVKELIVKPKEVDDLFFNLPSGALKAIDKRDNK